MTTSCAPGLVHRGEAHPSVPSLSMTMTMMMNFSRPILSLLNRSVSKLNWSRQKRHNTKRQRRHSRAWVPWLKREVSLYIKQPDTFSSICHRWPLKRWTPNVYSHPCQVSANQGWCQWNTNECDGIRQPSPRTSYPNINHKGSTHLSTHRCGCTVISSGCSTCCSSWTYPSHCSICSILSHICILTL